MQTLYRFFYWQTPQHYIEYNKEEICKEEMEFRIIYEDYPNHSSIMRTKIVDGVEKYTNIFLLKERRGREDSFESVYTQTGVYPSAFEMRED